MEKLKAIAKFVTDYQAKHHYGPSRRELAEEFDTSTSVIGFYVRHMLVLGMASYDPYISRSLTIINKGESHGN
jgi:hypothetical protein